MIGAARIQKEVIDGNKKETMDLLKEMDRKSVAMTVSKLKWSTEPSGGDEDGMELMDSIQIGGQ